MQKTFLKHLKQCYCTLSIHQKELMSKNLPKKKPINGVKKVVMITSSKGGVGKSTTTINLATSMKLLKPDKEIGILDADVFGPSIPLLMNVNETPLLTNDNKLIPLQNHGVKVMSMANLITDTSAVLWRGLMVMQAINKLIRDVDWNPCDILIIDTPPGTGDTHLSLAQNIPIDAALLVTTLDKMSLNVAQRGYTALSKLNIPIVGLIINMNSVKCPNCSHTFDIHHNALSHFEQLKILPILANIPIINQDDVLSPLAVTGAKDSEAGRSYTNLAVSTFKYLGIT